MERASQVDEAEDMYKSVQAERPEGKAVATPNQGVPVIVKGRKKTKRMLSKGRQMLDLFI